MKYVVSYDLHRDQSDEHYQRVAAAIGRFGAAMEIQRSVWGLKTSEPATTVRDGVGKALDDGDRLFVCPADGWAMTCRTEAEAKRIGNFLNTP